ncbi:MAG: PilZ domain-containing protein [Deltaproteobacteria bacterium]
MAELKIGTRINIVFENEINKSNAHYMKALVYDYEGSNITISQTSPALSRVFLNRRILVTFLGNADMRVLRFGFSAQLIDLITNYQIASTNKVEALILKQFGKPEPVDFRMHFRVKPTSQSDINLYFKEAKVNIIDISLMGAKFTYPKSYSFRSGDTLAFKLIIASTIFNLKGRVRSILLPNNISASNNIQFVGVEFEHDDRELDAILGKAILGIQRQLLSEGKMN